MFLKVSNLSVNLWLNRFRVFDSELAARWSVLWGYVLCELHLPGREWSRVNSLTGGSVLALPVQRKSTSRRVELHLSILAEGVEIADCGLNQINSYLAQIIRDTKVIWYDTMRYQTATAVLCHSLILWRYETVEQLNKSQLRDFKIYLVFLEEFIFSYASYLILCFSLFFMYIFFFDLLYLNILQFILPLWSLSRSFPDCDVFHLFCGLRNIMRMRYNRGITWCGKVPSNDKYIMNIYTV